MLFQCNQMLFQEICTSYKNLMRRDHWKSPRSLSYEALKAFKTQKELYHCLTTPKVFNTEKGHHHFLTTLKVFTVEKGLHHFFETLKGFIFEKWLHHILMTFKVFQSSYSVECWWTVASEGCLSYHTND